MGDLSTAGQELLSELLADAPEALRSVVYRRGTDDTSVHAIPDKLKFGESDGESIKVTDSAWLVFAHQIDVEPRTDDWLIEGDKSHFVISAQADDPAGILWRLITRA